jgi:hypothetical protein
MFWKEQLVEQACNVVLLEYAFPFIKEDEIHSASVASVADIVDCFCYFDPA